MNTREFYYLSPLVIHECFHQSVFGIFVKLTVPHFAANFLLSSLRFLSFLWRVMRQPLLLSHLFCFVGFSCHNKRGFFPHQLQRMPNNAFCGVCSSHKLATSSATSLSVQLLAGWLSTAGGNGFDIFVTSSRRSPPSNL